MNKQKNVKLKYSKGDLATRKKRQKFPFCLMVSDDDDTPYEEKQKEKISSILQITKNDLV